MNTFLQKHVDQINGTLSCFDRVLFKGYLPFTYPKALEGFLRQRHLLMKEFKPFVLKQAERLKGHAQRMAQLSGRPLIYLNGYIRKEDRAREIAGRDKIADGLVCIFSSVEPCQSFVLKYGVGRPVLEAAKRKCLCLYFYFQDKALGLIHVRIQTFFPFTIQIYMNGHEWLARKLDARDIAYEKGDNAFLQIDDWQKAQAIADSMTRQNWPKILDRLARRVNPLLGDLLSSVGYYWVTDQVEYATDVVFQNPETLQSFYPSLLKEATLSFGAEDILTFLERRLHGNFQGDVRNHYKKRFPGARVKHYMKKNAIKMYNKHGKILRIETTINAPREFKIRKTVTRGRRKVTGWIPMGKGVKNLYRYAEVSLTANHRYLTALSQVEDPTPAFRDLNRFSETQISNHRPVPGFNPVSQKDTRLFQAALRGEHVFGFRNRDLRGQLFETTQDPKVIRRQSAHVSRMIHRLHVHGLIAKIPHCRKWKVTPTGYKLMSASLHLKHVDFPNILLTKMAA